MANYPSTENNDGNLYIAVNNLSTSLTDNPLSAVATTVNVADTTNFPTIGILTVDLEAIHYTGKTGTSFIGCTRGFDGTGAAVHLLSSTVFHDIPAAHHNVLKDEVEAISNDLRDAFTVDLSDSVAPTATAVDLKERMDMIATQLRTIIAGGDWKDSPNDNLNGLSAELVAIQTDLDDAVTPVAAAADLSVRLDHIATQLKNITGEADWKTVPDVSIDTLRQNASNILLNGSFEKWTRGFGPFTALGVEDLADNWRKNITGTWTKADVSREGATIHSETSSLKFDGVRTSGTAFIYQEIGASQTQEFRSRTMSLGLWVNTSTASSVRIRLDDGISSTFSTYHTGSGSWERLTLTHTFNSSAANGLLYVQFEQTCVAYLDDGMFTFGEQLMDYTPTNQGIEDAKAGFIDTLKQNVPNILVNGGMEVWQRGTSFSPVTASELCADKWQSNHNGAPTINVTRESATANIDSVDNYSLKYDVTAIGTSTIARLLQEFSLPQKHRGKQITITARIKSDSDHVNMMVRAAGASTLSNYHTGGGAFETLTLTHTIPSSQTGVFQLAIGFNGIEGGLLPEVSTTYIDSVMCVMGDQALPFTPEDPQQELARCKRYYQRMGGLATAEFIASGYAYTVNDADFVIRLPVEMAGTPTVTVIGTATFRMYTNTYTPVVLTSLTPYFAHPLGVMMTGVAAGTQTMGFANALFANPVGAILEFVA